MARTRTQLRQLTVQQLGLPFIEGTSGTGSTTTLVDTPDLSQFRDDALIGSWVYVSDGSPDFRDLQITDSAQSTGTVTFIPALSAGDTNARTYEILPFRSTAIHQSIDTSLTQLYDMGLLVREFTFRGIVVGSPIYNANFELWATTTAVDGWVSDGAGVTQARERGTSANIAGSETSMKLVSNSGSEGRLSLNDPYRRFLWDMKGNTIKFYCWVKSSTASHARIGISNGSSITYSDYHPGDGDWNLLKAEYTSALSDTALFPTLAVANTNAAYFSDSWIQGGGSITEYPWPIPLAPDGPSNMALSYQGYDSQNALGTMRQGGGRRPINDWNYVSDHTYSFPSATSIQRGILMLPPGLPHGDRLIMQCVGPFTLPTADSEAVEVTLPESLMVAKMAARSLLERRLLQLPLSTRRVYEEMMQRLGSDVAGLSSGHGQSSDVVSFGPAMR